MNQPRRTILLLLPLLWPLGAPPPAHGQSGAQQDRPEHAPADPAADGAPVGSGGTVPMRRVGLRDYVAVVLERNLDVRIARLARDEAAEVVTGEAAAFDSSGSISTSLGRNRPPFYTSASSAAFYGLKVGVHPNQTDTFACSIGISRRFLTGATTSLDYRISRFEDRLGSNLNPRYSPNLTLQITQPLLRGSGREENRAGIRVARNNRKVARSDLEGVVAQLLADAQEQYWNLVFAEDQLEVKEQSLALAERLLAINRRKFEVGLVAELEVVTAEAGVAAQREGIIIARNELEDASDNAALLLLGEGDRFPTERLAANDEPVLEVTGLDLEASVTRALALRPELVKARLAVQNARWLAQRARRDRYPRADLSLTVEENGLGEDSRRSNEELASGDFLDWVAALSISYPFGNRAAIAAHRRTEVAVERARIALVQLEQRVVAEVRASVRAVRSARERVEATRVALRLAEDKLAKEEKKLEAGLSTSFQVLQFQEDLSEERTRAKKALIDHAVAVARLEAAEGTILTSFGVRVQ